MQKQKGISTLAGIVLFGEPENLLTQYNQLLSTFKFTK